MTMSPPAPVPTYFFFNDTATTEIYTLSLLDALPISDTSASPSTPTGSVSFASDGTGTFSPGTSCNLLAGAAGTASCAVTYTPTVVGTGTKSITHTSEPPSHPAARNRPLPLTVSPLAPAPTSTVVTFFFF